MKTLAFGLLFLVVLVSTHCAQAQGTRADYERARGLEEKTRGTVFNMKIEPHWIGDEPRFWYRRELRGGDNEYVLADAWAGRHPEMDLGRVGIYGGSAGGQNAMRALLDHGDFYKVAVADCGCHDNRMDKMWWNELWLGWPVGSHYEENSNVAHAHKLQGKLLLTVGEMDRNVDPASTMQVVNALIKADKDFDLLVVPGSDHGAGESPYAARRRQDFFVRHLLGVEPRR